VFNIIQPTIAHEFALIELIIIVEFQQNILPHVNPVPILMDHLFQVL
jgi:hypothetical protein